MTNKSASIEESSLNTNVVEEQNSNSNSNSRSTSPVVADDGGGGDHDHEEAVKSESESEVKSKSKSDSEESEEASNKRSSLKRTRSPSPSQTNPSKQAKLGYSIMNILSGEKKEKSGVKSTNNKENTEVDETSDEPSPNLLQSPLQSQQQPANPLNPFLLNPFLAAFSSLAAQNSASAVLQQQQSLLNNISNLAMLSNLNGTQKQQQNEFWPWLNMAAMSALYGLDSSEN